jgi:hypothetical protein
VTLQVRPHSGRMLEPDRLLHRPPHKQGT